MKRVKSSDDERGVSLLAVDQYVRHVLSIPALTAEEQAQLVVRIERGKTEQRKGCPDAVVLADAKVARDRFIEGMQRLVIFMARGWVHSFRGMELLDLVQEGNFGLLDMLEHRDLLALDNVGSVAVAAVRYRFHRLLRDRDGLVRVPGMVVEAVHKLREVRAQLSCELGRLPTSEEVAQAMGISVEQVRKLESDAKRERVASLDVMVDEDGQPFWENTFVSLFQQAVEAERERQEAVEQLVREALESSLTPWQREVVMRRYGLGQECQGSKLIGERYGVSRETVDGTDRWVRQKLAASLGVPYARLCGQHVEAEWYSAGQAAALLGLSLYEFTWLVRKGKISRLPGDRRQLARYARGDVERLAAEREEWSA
jgi:RNA polymerase primary sigma factor